MANTPSLHPYYVSVTEMEYNASTHALEISCRFFTDDFEITLRDNYKHKTDLLNPALKGAMEPMVKNYVTRHLEVKVNNHQRALNYIGFESDPETTSVYFEIPAMDMVSQIAIKQTLLYDYKPEQIGLIHVTVNGKRKSYKLVNPESEALFTF